MLDAKQFGTFYSLEEVYVILKTLQIKVTEASSYYQGSNNDKRKKVDEEEQNLDTEGSEKSISSDSRNDKKSKRRKTEKNSLEMDENDTDVIMNDLKKKKIEVVEVTETDEILENLKFTSYRLTQSTLDALKNRGILSLFPIQASTFDLIYDGKDVLARAKTGTGKTLAFALPIIEILLKHKQDKKFSSFKRGRLPKVIVMTPTRDLAKQISTEFESIAPSLKILCIYGGVAYDLQNQGLREGIDILVGTPGRVLDHIDRGNLKLSEVNFIVLDEADQMLDIGFSEAMETVLQTVKQHKEEQQQDKGVDYQTLLFSATVPDWVRKTVKKYLKADYVNVDLIGKEETKTNENIRHYGIRSAWSTRKDIIGDVVTCYGGSGSCVIFCNTKNDANELALNDKLKQDAQVLHGDIAQSQREITMKGFREGKFKCIICTDVLARGIDIPQVDVESYVHRAGRTARAGRLGTAVTLFKPQEEYLLSNIQRRAGVTFHMVGPPQPQDIIAATANDAVKNLESVESSVLPYFNETAKELINSQGAIEALSAALAYMSGYAGGIKKRSLMSAMEGYTTILFKFSFPIRHTSYVRSIFKKNFSDLSEDSVKGYKMTKDMQGVVCDIDNNKLEIGNDGQLILAGRPWYNTPTTTLEVEIIINLEGMVEAIVEDIMEDIHKL
ncbi:6604_t:CDS:2 [Diversispora eburnea]|uniref:RNA helicase n=1 Tax=Diversispora eburnea TaxID=1213867 RepID=A0A9N8ZFV5_9GLOM|nr:6604_t:CDS:2 [Diversispora eburnea]